MPKPKKRFWSSITRQVFPKMKLHELGDPTIYAGREVLARKEMDAPDELITIKTAQGSRVHLKHFEINGTHWVSMCSFFMQMIDGRVPTPEEEAEFELATQVKEIRSIDGKKEK